MSPGPNMQALINSLTVAGSTITFVDTMMYESHTVTTTGPAVVNNMTMGYQVSVAETEPSGMGKFFMTMAPVTVNAVGRRNSKFDEAGLTVDGDLTVAGSLSAAQTSSTSTSGGVSSPSLGSTSTYHTKTATKLMGACTTSQAPKYLTTNIQANPYGLADAADGFEVLEGEVGRLKATIVATTGSGSKTKTFEVVAQVKKFSNQISVTELSNTSADFNTSTDSSNIPLPVTWTVEFMPNQILGKVGILVTQTDGNSYPEAYWSAQVEYTSVRSLY